MKVTTLEIELAIMGEFNYRQNLIVPNITNQMALLSFETDMLVVKPSGIAYGFEIKVTKADLKADLNKPHVVNAILYANRNIQGIERFYGKFRHFYYAVPDYLEKDALEIIPDFCGLYVFKKSLVGYEVVKSFTLIKTPKKLFDYKWSDKERLEVARLGTMRIVGLKRKINDLFNNKTNN